MSMTVNQRIEVLREVMRRESLDAFIFPSTDGDDERSRSVD